MEKQDYVSAKTFLVVWAILMILTFLLVETSLSTLPMKDFLIVIMMLAQAYLVSFYFMHLRFEKLPLILSVVLGVLLTVLLLYFVIIWDGTRIVKLTS
jgi:cytochrome c oxidase subunit IV